MTVFYACARPSSQGDAYLASTGCIPRSESSPQEDALKIARLAVALQAHCEK